MPSKDTQFTKENAREMQARSSEARNRNKERRKALKDILYVELEKPISEGSEITKAEWLVVKMIQNLKDDIKPTDLKTIQEILGEAVSKHEIRGKAPEHLINELMNEF